MLDGNDSATMRQALSLTEDQIPMLPALLIIFSLVTTQARLHTCAVQDQSFRDQLSDDTSLGDHDGIDQGRKKNQTENE